jgi:Leucine-rich repeat (LRR) protein
MEIEEENTSISQHNLDVTCLDLSHDKSLTDISFIRNFPNLVELNLEKNYPLGNNYKPICEIVSLTKLNLSRMDITLPEPLKFLINLQELNLAQNQIETISALTSLKLHTLSLSGNWRIKDLYLIGKITTLISLDISHIYSEEGYMQPYYPTLDFLHSLTDLKYLNLCGSYSITNIDSLQCIPNLEILDIHDCMHIENYDPVNNFPSLKTLIARNARIGLFPVYQSFLPSINAIFK